MFCIKDFTEIMKRITLLTVGLSLLLLSGLDSNGQSQLSKTNPARNNLFADKSERKIPEINRLAKKVKRSKHFAVRRKVPRYSGKWKGTLYQPEGTLRSKFKFTVWLSQKGRKVTGFSRITMIDAPQYYGVMKLRGTIRGNRLSFTETRITRENIEPDAMWCIKSGKLRSAYVKGKLTLKGNWQGANCSPGSVFLKKVGGK